MSATKTATVEASHWLPQPGPTRWAAGPLPGATIPASHRDLLQRPLTAALTTLLPDGQPQTHPVWFSFEEPWLLVSTMRGFRKERNMRADPRVTLLLVDPRPGTHWIELRGVVELVENGAGGHLDALANRYAGAARYFGDVVPAELAATEVPVMGCIRPVRVVTDIEADTRVGQARRRAGPVATGAQSAGPCMVVPVSHRDLLAWPVRAALSTLMPGGQPQTQPVWCDFDGTCVLVNTTRERQKGRNLEADPRATILVVDPENAARWIEVRGDVTITEDDALAHLDRLTWAYTGRPRYYGGIVPAARQALETRIICRIHPRHVVCDAIHH